MRASKVGAPLACYQNSVVFLVRVIVVACVEIGLASQRNVYVEGGEMVDSLLADDGAAAASLGKERFDVPPVPSAEEASEALEHRQDAAAGSSDRWGTSS